MWNDFSQYPMFWVCCPVILLSLYGFCRSESLWSILIKAFCFFFASMFALNYFQPLANLLDRFLPSMAYYNDMWAFLIIYGLVLFLEIFVTNLLSRINLFFPAKVNLIGNSIILASLFAVFYFCVAPLFFYLIPEAPPRTDFAENSAAMPQFSLFEMMSKGSLKPIAGGNEFHFIDDFYKMELTKNAAVYSQVLAVSGKENAKGDEWKFKGNLSPNVSAAPAPQ